MPEKQKIATVKDIKDLFDLSITSSDLTNDNITIDVNVKDKNGNTFWHYRPGVIIYGNTGNTYYELVDLYDDANEQKIDLSTKNNKGISVLSSVIQDNYQIFDLYDRITRTGYFTNLDYTAQNEDGLSLLMCAIRNRTEDHELDSIKEMCRHPEILNLQDKNGNTALHYACMEEFKPNITLIRDLIHAGADVTIKNNFGLCPIDTATQEAAKTLAPYMPKEVETQQNSADQLNKVMIGLLMVLVKSMPLNKEQQKILNQAENILNGSDTHQPRSVAKSPIKRSKSQKSNERAE